MVRRKIVEYFGLEGTIILFYCINAGGDKIFISILKLKDVIVKFYKVKNADKFRATRTKKTCLS